MKLLLLFTFLFSQVCALYSQTNTPNNNSFSAQLDFVNQQTQIYEQNGIVISAELVKCNDPSIGMEKDYIFFTFENTNSYKVNIYLDQHLYYENICRTCTNDEYHEMFSLKAREKVTTSCTKTSNKSFKIFHGSPWVNEKLSKFELVNIEIHEEQ